MLNENTLEGVEPTSATRSIIEAPSFALVYEYSLLVNNQPYMSVLAN